MARPRYRRAGESRGMRTPGRPEDRVAAQDVTNDSGAPGGTGVGLEWRRVVLLPLGSGDGCQLSKE